MYRTVISYVFECAIYGDKFIKVHYSLIAKPVKSTVGGDVQNTHRVMV